MLFNPTIPPLFLAFLLLLTLVTPFASAWSKEDHELFRLRDELHAHESPNTTFYTFLNLTPAATSDDITKSYRRLSRTLHPDKARSAWQAAYDVGPAPKLTSPKDGAAQGGEKPGVRVHKHRRPSASEVAAFNKAASARFERLSLIANLLRDSDERARYDHFLNNGFPVWRGTGYYYERFRPGLGTVLLGLFVLVGGVGHYGVLCMSWRQRKEFVQRYIRQARKAAWGDEGALGAIPGLGGAAGSATTGGATAARQEGGEDSMQWNRKQKRAMDRDKKKRDGVKNVPTTLRARLQAEKEARKESAGNSSSGINTPTTEEEQEQEVNELPIASTRTVPVGAKKRTRAENGKILIVDSIGNVFLEDENVDEDAEGGVREYLLDPDEEPRPSIRDTFLVQGPLYLYVQSVGRVLNRKTASSTPENAWGVTVEETLPRGEDDADILPGSPNGYGEAKKRRRRNEGEKL